MLKYIINYLFPKQPFEIQKPRKYITFDEYDELSDRAKILLHSKYDVYLIPEVIFEEQD